jgi:N-hydroxyarylamine O-acetyltransferase
VDFRPASNLGFPVERLAARVFREDGSLGIAFDHLCLRVIAGGQAWLVDVGFGDNFAPPLVLDDPREQDDGRRRYRIEPDTDERILWAGAGRSYRFGLTPFALADFEPGRRYHTTSPESHFTARRVISLLTPDGRVTLRDDRLIVTAGADRREEPVAVPGEWRRLAAERFGIDLDPR